MTASPFILSPLAVAHIYMGAQYNPSLQGAIQSVSFSWDSQEFSRGRDFTLYKPLIYQGGAYFTPINIGNVPQAGGWRSFSSSSTVVSDFQPFGNTGRQLDKA